jgi:hypothetical protein
MTALAAAAALLCTAPAGQSSDPHRQATASLSSCLCK